MLFISIKEIFRLRKEINRSLSKTVNRLLSKVINRLRKEINGLPSKEMKRHIRNK